MSSNSNKHMYTRANYFSPTKNSFLCTSCAFIHLDCTQGQNISKNSFLHTSCAFIHLDWFPQAVPSLSHTFPCVTLESGSMADWHCSFMQVVLTQLVRTSQLKGSHTQVCTM